MKRLAALGAAALWLGAGSLAVAQQPELPGRRWFVTGGLGLVGREIGTWNGARHALDSTGWGTTPNCAFFCPTAADVVEGRPAAPALAVRRRMGGQFQMRAFISRSSPGHYPGRNNGVPLSVTPHVTTVGAQATFVVGRLWLAAGPTWYGGRVRTRTDSGNVTGRRAGAGFALGAGLILGGPGRFFMELAVERRLAGTVRMPDIAFAGTPVVPAMSVPLSHTLLSAGAGLRL